MEDARDEITHGMAAARPGGGNWGSGADSLLREWRIGFGHGRAPQLDQTQVAALAGCLELHGFEVADGAANLQTLFGGSPPSAELQEALSECGAELGVTLPGGFGGGGPVTIR